MRYGVIADVHANLPALEAVLDHLRSEAVDAYLCAGDLVGYGPFPDECVQRVASLPGVCVAGNHDLIALGRMSTDRCIRLARETLEWTARTLDASSREYLGALPLDARLPGGVVIAHGARGDPQEYVRSADEVRRELGKLEGDERILVLGHTHEQLLGHEAEPIREPARFRTGIGWDPAERALVNPGSVGQSRTRDPRARFAILDVEQSWVTYHAVEYDADATRRALRDRGLPENACHLPPRSPLRRAVGRAARAVLRR